MALANMPAEGWLTVNEVARLLGMGVRSVWRMTEDGRLPQPIRLSVKMVRWDCRTMAAYLKRMREEAEAA